jgi:hypothetical protein
MDSPFPDDKRDEEVKLVAPTTAALKPNAVIVFMIGRKL